MKRVKADGASSLNIVVYFTVDMLYTLHVISYYYMLSSTTRDQFCHKEDVSLLGSFVHEISQRSNF